MAGSIFHKIQGELVFEQLKERGLAPQNIKAYLWGIQGPDFMYCHRNLPFQKGESIADWGKKIQLKTIDQIIPTVNSFISLSDDKDFFTSYLYGLIAHYMADTIVHSYIRYKTTLLLPEMATESETTVHNEIESALDTIVLRGEKNKLPTEVSIGALLPMEDKLNQKISRLWNYIFKGIFGEEISESTFTIAQKDAHLAFSLMTDRTGLKRNFFNRFENGGEHKYTCHFRPFLEDSSFDYGNLYHEEWLDENNHKHNEDIFDLLSISVEKSLEIILSL